MSTALTLTDLYQQEHIKRPVFSFKDLYTQAKAQEASSLNTLAQTTVAGLFGTGGKYVLDVQQIPDNVKTAFAEAFPNMALSDLAGKPASYLEGIEHGWKGKLFEVMVRDELNAGNAVGSVQLAPGQVAQLATKLNQPEWDLQILDVSGQAVKHLQLKATSNLQYIQDTLERYPDTTILTTAEIPTGDMVLSSNITEASLAETTAAASETLADGVFNTLDFTVTAGLFIGVKTLLKRGWNLSKIKALVRVENDKLKHIKMVTVEEGKQL